MISELAGPLASVGTGAAVAGAAVVGVAAAVGLATAALAAGTKAVADYAGQMSDLSSRIGQTVGDTVILTQAFKAAGMGPESVGQGLNLLQKALTGVNEKGEPTAAVFARLGININDLKAQTGVEQLETISKAISGISNPADQTRAAMELFGESGARMLALLKDDKAISGARETVGSLAGNLEECAGILDGFSDALESLEVKNLQFFAGFAKAIAQELEKASGWISKLDFGAAGEGIGDFVHGVILVGEEIAKIVGEAVDLIPESVLDVTAALYDALVSILSPLSLIKDAFNLFREIGHTDNAANSKSWTDNPAIKAREAAAAQAKAEADAAAAAAKALALKRAQLDLEIQLSEAKANGNQLEQRRLTWLAAYKATKDKDGTEEQAVRAADAALADPAAARDLANLEADRRARALGTPEAIESDQYRLTYQATWDKAISAGQTLPQADTTATAAAADQAAQNQAKRDTLDLELQLNDAKLSGNTLEERRLKWIQAYNAAKKDPTTREDQAQRLAAQATTEDPGLAAKRESLALALSLAQATADGNDKEASRLRWIQAYNQQLETAKAAGMELNAAYDYASQMATLADTKPTTNTAASADRLTQIGLYNTTTGATSNDTPAKTTAKYTEATAKGIAELNRRFSDTTATTGTF